MTDSAVVDRMQATLAAFEENTDSRAIFLNCYLLMTRNVLGAIGRAEFHDGAWVAAFLERFAGYYFAALEAYEQDHAALPAVWRQALDATRRPETMPVQNLLLGVNAHINYDLVLTLVDALEPEWAQLSPAQRERRRADHDQINEIIARTVDSVQDQVLERYSPWMDAVDRLFGRLDEWAASRLIAHWRTQDWEHAMRWLDTAEEDARDALRQELERSTLQLADRVLLGRG